MLICPEEDPTEGEGNHANAQTDTNYSGKSFDCLRMFTHIFLSILSIIPLDKGKWIWCTLIMRINKLKKVSSGFTLIELLVVIAILGVLAAAILVALNPLEQLARARDAGRKTTVDQMGHAVASYYATQNAVFPTQGAAWLTTLQTAAEIKNIPTNPSAAGYTIGCNTANIAQNGYCYQANATDAIVYARAESQSSKTTAGCVAAQTAWVVWSSADGRTGLTCLAANTDPAIGITGLK